MDNNFNDNNNLNNNSSDTEDNGYSPYSSSKTSSTFAIVSLVLGMIGLFSITTVVTPLICGSLAVIFAILSKGSDTRFSPRGRTGFTVGLVSSIGSIAFVCITMYLVIFNQNYRDYMNKQYEERLGITFDEYVDVLKDALDGELSEDALDKINSSLDNNLEYNLNKNFYDL